jgi:dTDP-4-dehydrorhamnose reductase
MYAKLRQILRVMIYLLGGSGYVGQAYQRLFRGRDILFKSLRRSEIDYTDPRILLVALQNDRPEFLINASGYTGKPNVDACEWHKGECLFANAVVPGRIAEACESAGVPWGHISSGCIYSGEKSDGGGFTEEDIPNFTFRSGYCSFYSGTKALGEEVLNGRNNVYIWRMRIPFDHVDDARNYLSKLMRYARLLEAKNSLSELQEFASATFACWERRVPYGTYNVTNPGKVTTREVVDLILNSDVCQKEFSFFDSEAEFMRVAARTPRSNCTLDSSKLMHCGIKMTEVHEAIARDLSLWQSLPR